MISVRSEVLIDRPIEDVYEFLADARNDPRWCPPVKEVRRLDGNDHTRRYQATVKPGPKVLTNTFEVVAEDPPAKISFRGSNEMGSFDGFYRLEQADGGTRVIMLSNLAVHGGMKILSPIMSLMSRRNAAEQFRRLKAILEA